MNEQRVWPAVMADLETLSTAEDGVIVEVGVVAFDPETREMGPSQGWSVGAVQPGRSLCPETVGWWFGKIGKGTPAPDLRVGLPLAAVLAELWEWWGRHCHAATELWCRGAMDSRMMEHAFRNHHPERRTPWDFWNVRDQRTALEWEGVEKSPAGHGALDDARIQVSDLFRAMDARKLTVNFERGWETYRHLLATNGCTGALPSWKELPEDVMASYIQGVLAAVDRKVTVDATKGREEMTARIYRARRELLERRGAEEARAYDILEALAQRSLERALFNVDERKREEVAP